MNNENLSRSELWKNAEEEMQRISNAAERYDYLGQVLLEVLSVAEGAPEVQRVLEEHFPSDEGGGDMRGVLARVEGAVHGAECILSDAKKGLGKCLRALSAEE